jgi:DoxX-like family
MNKVHKLINYLIAAIWLINGLFCKLMGMLPRHELIVSMILGDQHATMMTKLIGTAEILMTLWILSGTRKQLNAIFQIVVIMSMNILEFILVPDLLLWGRFNLVFAILFSGLIYYNTFVLYKTQAQPNHA